MNTLSLLLLIIYIVFFDRWRVLVQEPIQNVGRFTHEAVDDIDSVLVALIGCVIVQCDPAA